MTQALTPSAVLSEASQVALTGFLDDLRRKVEMEAQETARAQDRRVDESITPEDIVTIARRGALLGPWRYPKNESLRLSPAASAALREHLERIYETIVSETESIVAKDRPGAVPGPAEVMTAVRRYAPGTRFPHEDGFSSRLASSVSMITLLSLFAAIVFGFLGLWQGAGSNGYIDIAKVFVGVVVGSAVPRRDHDN